MRLSEAMRLGAMSHPQAFGWSSADGGTCALGAALEAAGAPITWPEAWVVLIKLSPAVCPACALVRHSSGIVNATGAIIVHLNDRHRWTRERIADFVETIERAQETAQQDQPAEVTA